MSIRSRGVRTGWWFRTTLSTGVAALGFLAIPTDAGAHGGNNDANVVHACIGNVSRVARIVGLSGSCIPAPPLVAETPAHWAIQGPQGAPGINGTNGIDGTPGINGTDGQDGTNGTDGTGVTFVDYFSGNQHGCPNGGTVFATGNPPVPAYICNGADGQDGRDGQDATLGATRPAPPCFDNENRYVVCGNGTVTDTVTGLIWLQDAACLGSGDYATANGLVAALANGHCALTDGSAAGDWRLPTKDEWAATIARAAALGCTGSRPSLTNARGTGCLGQGGPLQFTGVGFYSTGGISALDFYWSSTGDETFPVDGWFASFVGGFVESNDKTFILRVWPVRGASR